MTDNDAVNRIGEIASRMNELNLALTYHQSGDISIEDFRAQLDATTGRTRFIASVANIAEAKQLRDAFQYQPARGDLPARTIFDNNRV